MRIELLWAPLRSFVWPSVYYLSGGSCFGCICLCLLLKGVASVWPLWCIYIPPEDPRGARGHARTHRLIALEQPELHPQTPLHSTDSLWNDIAATTVKAPAARARESALR